MRHDPGNSMIFCNLLLVPKHMSFICMDTPMGSRLQHGWGSLRPYHHPAGSCDSIPVLLPEKTNIHFSSLANIANKPQVAQLITDPDAEYGRHHHLSH